jgi:hypothetical protein
MLAMKTFISNKPFRYVNTGQRGLEGYETIGREEEDSSSIPPPSMGLLSAGSIVQLG